MSVLSPMMQQYVDIKKQYESHILLFRLGDFYEMFFEDAKIASSELDIALTGRDCGQDERAPMCGVPYHSVDQYIAKLIAKGYKVAICEQLEDPAVSKGIVKRDVVRVITPATVTESSMLDQSKNNYFACILVDHDEIALCFADVSTGEIFSTCFKGEGALQTATNEIEKYSPKEAILNQAAYASDILRLHMTEIECAAEVVEEAPQAGNIIKTITDHFGVETLTELQIEDQPLIVRTLSLLLSYLKATQKNEMAQLKKLQVYYESEFMYMDAASRRNLELTETIRSREKKGSLLSIIDHTRTAMGARLMRKWLEHPLTNLAKILQRQASVGELVKKPLFNEDIRAELRNIADIERLITKVIYGTANARDLNLLASAFAFGKKIREMISSCESQALKGIFSAIDPLDDLSELILSAIVDDPPIILREGGIIRDGYRDDLDELRDIMTSGHQVIAQIESREREKTGIKNLKIAFNKVFGYYIEITKSNYDLVPERYIRKQTLVNCERYITPELKETEDRIIGAKDRIISLEYELFVQLRDRIALETARIQETASALASLDALCSLANTAISNHYVMPEVNTGDIIEIKDGRHPVVEMHLGDSRFVPNDTLLDCTLNRVAIITGPNMAGKSTYMRQIALIVILAQIGSFVPAGSARIGICDAIFTRVGAADDLAAGQSTFMVEMVEVANILKNATPKSLIVFDEIGRGTSTFDGMSIARAVVEYVNNSKTLGAKTLFATHYHELTDMEEAGNGIKNYNVSVKKRGDDITFLRRIIPGGADESYGIEVAKLAGVPEPVIKRAKEILSSIHQMNGSNSYPTERRADEQILQQSGDLQPPTIYSMVTDQVVNKIRQIDISVLTPLEALNLLHQIQKELL